LKQLKLRTGSVKTNINCPGSEVDNNRNDSQITNDAFFCKGLLELVMKALHFDRVDDL